MANVARVNGLDLAFDEHSLDVLAMPMDSPIASMAAASGKSQSWYIKVSNTHSSGYPIATMPLGLLDYNGRPFGLGVMAKPDREDLIFQFLSAFEAKFPKRKVPPGLPSSKASAKKGICSNM